MGTEPYDRGFYARQHAANAVAAQEIMQEVFRLCPGVRSVLDVGCGVGTWLWAAGRLGAAELLGLEGPWVKEGNVDLAVPPEQVRSCDLRGDWDPGRPFDLAISLEVAEHLPATVAEDFVARLAAAAPRVLFSAAIPFQGGIAHQNEQWPSYWAALFARHGLAPYDVIRPAFWTNDDISHHYRQNTLLYLRPDAVAGSLLAGRPPAMVSPALNLVHPLQLRAKQGEVNGLQAKLDSPLATFKHHVRRWLPRRPGPD